MNLIDCQENLDAGLQRLLRRDRRLRAISKVAGPVTLRHRPAGFSGLARIIVAQQLSVASATAIWGRFEAALPDTPAADVLAADDRLLKSAGLSIQKIRTLRAIAEADVNGLDLAGLGALDREAARARLTAIPGVGPWTADVYLMFCLGYPDIFPAGDLALRKGVALAFGMSAVDPGPEATDEVAAGWAPDRTVAAYLFWAYYGATRRREGLPA